MIQEIKLTLKLMEEENKSSLLAFEDEDKALLRVLVLFSNPNEM